MARDIMCFIAKLTFFFLYFCFPPVVIHVIGLLAFVPKTNIDYKMGKREN